MTILIKNLVFALLAMLLGVFGFVFAFCDLGLGESWLGPAMVTVLFFFLCGFGFGFLNPDGWMIGGLTAWGCIILGILSLLAAIRPSEGISDIPLNPPLSAGLILLFIPAGLGLIGGYIGKTLKLPRPAERGKLNDR